MRKFSGELFDASPTICAMGREEEFDAISNKRFYQNFQLSPLFFGSLGRSNFYGMVVDTAWATISMAALISMRGQLAPAVAIAVYNQLEELNNSIGLFFTVNDAAAQMLPNWMRVMDFLDVKECVGKSCIEEDTRTAPPGWPADGGVRMSDVVFDYRTGAPSALNGISIDIQPGEKIGVCGRSECLELSRQVGRSPGPPPPSCVATGTCCWSTEPATATLRSRCGEEHSTVSAL
jgi:ABC-type multidrug transport system fused ATPase/permease subunit|eukprot:COSAG02_NODE_327_length_24561_cov_92.867754_20_plen_234_part_00